MMIRLTLQRRLFLAIFALACALVVLLLFTMRWSLVESFGRYTSAAELGRLDWLVDNIEKQYAAHGNWEFLRTDTEQQWRRLTRPNPDSSFSPRHPPPLEMRPPLSANEGTRIDRLPPADMLRILPRLSLTDAGGGLIAGQPERSGTRSDRPVVHNGMTVGKLILQASPVATQHLEQAFLANLTHYMLLAAAGTLGLSLLGAWWLSRHLLAPILDMHAGARGIAAGSLDTRIPIRQDDELGELAETFNIMAERLACIEESRRAWISDTSHELRTPLAVLRAEIEALQDGVRSADEETLARLHKQIRQLTTLVDDLRQTLQQDPAGKPMERALFCPLEILNEVLAAFRERYAAAGIAIETAGLEETGSVVRGDAGRLFQVFSNLLENTLRYTDPGGRLLARVEHTSRSLMFRFDDTAPAPPRTALPRLFERFFRAESSRNRVHGGSGLGLAICKTLVEAHGGTISADLSALGGLAIRIELPVEKG